MAKFPQIQTNEWTKSQMNKHDLKQTLLSCFQDEITKSNLNLIFKMTFLTLFFLEFFYLNKVKKLFNIYNWDQTWPKRFYDGITFAK